jgi:hypothetical protein
VDVTIVAGVNGAVVVAAVPKVSKVCNVVLIDLILALQFGLLLSGVAYTL